MVKFPICIHRDGPCYLPNTIIEDLACRILRSMNLLVQNTFLATYSTPSNENKIVVACEAFYDVRHTARLAQFSHIRLGQTAGDWRIGSSTMSIDQIAKVISREKMLAEYPKFIDNVWELFVADTLIYNLHRGLDDFGFIIDYESNEATFAPIYNCDESLGMILSEHDTIAALKDGDKYHSKECDWQPTHIVIYPMTSYRETYAAPRPELIAAINRLLPQINLTQIQTLINATPELSAARREFIFSGIRYRYENLLLLAMQSSTS